MRRNPVRIVAALLLAALVAAPPARARDLIPPNDNFADATVVDELPYTSVRDLGLATREPKEPLCGLVGGSIWYRYDAIAATELGVWLRWDSSAVVAVYEGTQLGALASVSGCEESARFTTVPGTTYYVQVSFRLPYLPSIPHDNAVITVSALGAIEGVVRDDLGVPAAGVCVHAWPLEAGYDWGAYGIRTDADGRYRVPRLAPGRYAVEFGCYEDLYEREAWNDRTEGWDSVTVPGGQTVAGIDAELIRRSGIRGTFFDDGGNPIAYGGCPIAYDAATGGIVADSYADENGRYLMPIRPGTYKVFFSCTYARSARWYPAAETFEDAAEITVAAREVVSGIDARLPAWTQPPGDTIETAIEIDALPFAVNGKFGDARYEEQDRAMCDGYDHASLWLRYTAASDEPLVVSIDDEVPLYSIWLVTSAGMDRISCTDDNDGLRSAAFTPEPGGTYLIQVATWNRRTARITADTATGPAEHVFSAAVPCASACPYSPRSVCQSSSGAPPGSWDDVDVTVPGTVEGRVPAYMVVDLAPGIDRDVFICDTQGRFVAQGANTLTQDCSAMPIGCRETIAVGVQPGQQYVIRVYNWSDVQPAPGTILFVVQR